METDDRAEWWAACIVILIRMAWYGVVGAAAFKYLFMGSH